MLGTELIKYVRESASGRDAETVEQAIALAVKSHKGQFRKSGEPYVVHPVAVATLLWQQYADIPLVVAALLHDTVEDTPLTLVEIEEKFGMEVSMLVDAVTKRPRSDFDVQEVRFDDQIDRFLRIGLKDCRVFLLKLADRSHNMATIAAMPDYKQVKISFETQMLYEPLKQLVSWNEDRAIADIGKDVSAWCIKHQVKTPEGFKKALLRMSSFDLDSDNELFYTLYNDSNSVVWSLEDYDTYIQLTESEDIAQSVCFHTVEGNKSWFRATFTFNKALLLPTLRAKLSSYHNILSSK